MKTFLYFALLFSVWLTQIHVVVHDSQLSHGDCSICEVISHFPLASPGSLDFAPTSQFNPWTIERIVFHVAAPLKYDQLARGPPHSSLIV